MRDIDEPRTRELAQVKTPDEITQALEKGDFFIREIVTKGLTLFERPD